MLFPLLALDALVGGIWFLLLKLFVVWTQSRGYHLMDARDLDHFLIAIWVLATLAASMWLDWLIVRHVWRAVNGKWNAPPSIAPPTAPNTPLATVAWGFAWTSGIAAGITWILMLRPPEFLVWSILITAIVGLALAIPARHTPRGKWAMWFCTGSVLVWVLVWSFFAFAIPLRQPPEAEKPAEISNDRSRFPKGYSSPDNSNSFYFKHDDVDVHFLLYYAGQFGVEDRSTYNAHSFTWLDDGSIKLESGRSFGYRRESVAPFHLRVNGEEFDLRKGFVFVLHDDGRAEQRNIAVPLATAQDRYAIAKLLGPTSNADTRVAFDPIREADLRVLQQQYEKTLNDLYEAEKEKALAVTKNEGTSEERERQAEALQTKIQLLEKRCSELRAQLQAQTK
jgi:hypothetical protein